MFDFTCINFFRVIFKKVKAKITLYQKFSARDKIQPVDIIRPKAYGRLLVAIYHNIFMAYTVCSLLSGGESDVYEVEVQERVLKHK